MYYFCEMDAFETAIYNYSTDAIPILDRAIPFKEYVPLDLSKQNTTLKAYDITDYRSCQAYIDTVLRTERGKIAYGGYLEHRNLYSNHKNFTDMGIPIRNIHLGIDYWCNAGTIVQVPLDGTVHSFKNNDMIGDYGPTILLQHILESHTFYSLYGHLSMDSLDGLYIGKAFHAGQTLGRLGTPDINVNYAPHLHFQLIKDLEGYQGDYPGVCAEERLDFYRKNCPSPNLLLKLGVPTID